MKGSVALALLTLAICGVRCEYTSIQTGICNATSNTNEWNGYRKVGNKYYYIDFGEEVDWMQAWMRCRQRNGYLASMENVDELNALADLLKEIGTKEWMWVDGTYLNQSKDFRWVTNGRPVSWDLFSRRQPDSEAEKCLQVWPEGDTFRLSHNVCDTQLNFICQMHQVKVQVTML